MNRQYVFYRDIEMVAEWPEKIRSAQEIRSYIIGGHQYARVRFGREPGTSPDGPPRSCGDCAVLRGELHVPGCDLECCPVCRGQIISCGCEVERPQV